jgi:hypothetical protein
MTEPQQLSGRDRLSRIYFNHEKIAFKKLFEETIYPICEEAAKNQMTEVYIVSHLLGKDFPFEKASKLFQSENLKVRVNEGDHGDAPYGIYVSGWTTLPLPSLKNP